VTENEIDAIRKRLEACPIPENAEADWRDTNHFEIQVRSDVDDFWWLDVFDVPQDSSTEDGRRLGAVLDYACAYRRDVGVLLERITDLEVAARYFADEGMEWVAPNPIHPGSCGPESGCDAICMEIAACAEHNQKVCRLRAALAASPEARP